jgi:peptidyl-tRNA hydrolase, PTH2 family
MNMQDYEKQIIVLRKDLDMGKGKLIAQGAHASMGAILRNGSFQTNPDGKTQFVIDLDPAIEGWLRGSFTKIAVWCADEAELMALHHQALDAGLHTILIKDNGKTAFHGVPTHTAIAIGPALASVLDPITRHLKLIN